MKKMLAIVILAGILILPGISQAGWVKTYSTKNRFIGGYYKTKSDGLLYNNKNYFKYKSNYKYPTYKKSYSKYW